MSYKLILYKIYATCRLFQTIIILWCDVFRFNDIPSIWWQISTILIGGATAITVIVAVSAISACCVTHVIQKSTAKVAGYLQLLAGKCILCSVSFFFIHSLPRKDIIDSMIPEQVTYPIILPANK